MSEGRPNAAIPAVACVLILAMWIWTCAPVLVEINRDIAADWAELLRKGDS